MRILLFGGTTEGRALSRELAALGAQVTVSVATPYGKEVQGEAPGIRVLQGRLDEAAMTGLLRGMDLCLDATHPYAVEATRTIRQAAQAAGVPLRRLLRRPSPLPPDSLLARDAEEAVSLLAGLEGNILLTTGAKEVGRYASLGGARLYPRVLPSPESLAACAAAGIPRGNVIAMQGPFSAELNLALIHQFRIRILVTKDGGEAGGFPEKVQAAREAAIPLLVLRRPPEEGEDAEEILRHVKEMLR